jgi:phenylalanyl-tRNA synthetase beta chain|uniref:Phenylalanine--tRNA ligase beta subunit, chloroplastic n=2 Tax=Phaeodactylum tricornutum TaxID=2850 RepID=SYFB_PHATC|nr:phenylalanyl-tRNA synthetase beta chain [Phaeodactylum tricornutum]A0T0H4.1 RecName: Full=Phenylalanine--tRNA ligase beta subunit, chloroplastic; AltName: Full=Phenylalanyl-tRNA synthetase beta subunit; Short=PheRS [Phaeodactylum tricornutum CCAP 1055/1]ABK20672.1 phenylalanine tRNA synthetase [Phaeodactylum tricornutum]QHR85626.1 phenylalanine tRNA synthetase [Phaeodactylum tricornutum]
MQISLKWIKELIDIENVDLDDLIEKLTLGGFEVEEILELEINNEKQIALEISSTANRSDSLSIQGISVEIASLFNKQPKVCKYFNSSLNWQQKIKNLTTIRTSKTECLMFTAVILEGLEDLTVPKWIQNKLVSSGIMPLNNLVDFQNYILLETGYPFAFYDLDKVYSKVRTPTFSLSIEKAENGSEFFASNQINYKLDNSIFLVQANNIPISIAGIIENDEIICHSKTSSLLIEGSIFSASKIRQQSRKLAIRTDRSARYEKSLKSTYLIEALYRLISLLRISNPSLVYKFHSSNKVLEKVLKPIVLNYKTIVEILGPIKKRTNEHLIYISPETVTDYLKRLNFKFLFDSSTLNWEVTIPSIRSDDITREIDLIEEVGRLHGFNNFLTMLPQIKSVGRADFSYQTRKKITSYLLNMGLTELIHYSLVSNETFLKNEIKLVNPLLSDCSTLRVSLLPSLLMTIQENLKQGNSILEGFEYGHVFSGNIETTLTEIEYVGGIFGGTKIKSSWFEKGQSLKWFEAKGKIEKLFQQLNLGIHWRINSQTYTKKFLHPYRSAEIFLSSGKNIGVFGQLHPLLANKLGLSSEIYLFELNLELIQQSLQQNKLTIYSQYSVYPKIVKDLSFIIKKNIKFDELEKIIYANGTEFLSQINLLDDYKGEFIPEKHTSLCLQLTFQSNKKTLENKEIDRIVKNLKRVLELKVQAILRE